MPADAARWARTRALMLALERVDWPALASLEVRGIAGEAGPVVDVWLKHAHDAQAVLDALPLAGYGWPWQLTGAPTWEPITGNPYRVCRGVMVVDDVDIDVRVYAPVLDRVTGGAA